MGGREQMEREASTAKRTGAASTGKGEPSSVVHRRRGEMRKGRSRGWSVFDAIKTFPASPETLMAEIDAAIASVEYAHATALLSSIPSSTFPSNTADTKNPVAGSSGIGGSSHDTRLAEEAYREACAALASGQPDAALRSIRVALASCPLDKISAVAKLRSLSSIASAQLQKQKKQNEQKSPLV